MFWKIVECLNNIIVNTLTSDIESNKDTDDLRKRWQKRIWYSSDEQINRYLDRHGLYYSIEENGRYKCENVLIDYFVKEQIDPYYI